MLGGVDNPQVEMVWPSESDAHCLCRGQVPPWASTVGKYHRGHCGQVPPVIVLPPPLLPSSAQLTCCVPLYPSHTSLGVVIHLYLPCTMFWLSNNSSCAWVASTPCCADQPNGHQPFPCIPYEPSVWNNCIIWSKLPMFFCWQKQLWTLVSLWTIVELYHCGSLGIPNDCEPFGFANNQASPGRSLVLRCRRVLQIVMLTADARLLQIMRSCLTN